jgi:hypothetical protein
MLSEKGESNMDYQQFVAELTDKVRERTAEGETVEVRSVPHNNSTMMDGLTITRPGQLVVPNIYLEPYFDRYRDGSGLDEIADEIVCQNERRVCPEGMTYGDLHSFERICGSIRFRLISRDLNGELLRSVPHRPFMDLEMICFYRPQVMGIPEASALVQNGDLPDWNITEEELFRLAMDQTAASEKPRLRHITDVIRDIGPEEEASEDSSEGTMAPMFVLSNESGIFGAACMAYPDLFARVAEKLGMDFWILPSSIHELILLPDYGMYTAAELGDLVKSVNLSSVPPWEVLSDSVYRYDRKHHQLTMELYPD